MSSYSHFFDTMEDAGFFEHIYEHLPEDFTSVFEIARILEDPEHPLTHRLMPALSLTSASAGINEIAPDAGHERFVQTGEEYEAQLMRSLQDLSHIYTYQWLLPEEIFLRKAAERSLWVPYARDPTSYAIQSESSEFSPDSRKQKVYILLDTSSSMGIKSRIHLAKAVVYHFLKRNLKELGFISLRTFNVGVGDLHVARDRDGFHALLRYVMRIHTLGNGTAMAKAILRAVEDIRDLPQLSGTEILIVTDGACVLDEDLIRELMGDTIRIHTVKIGKTQLFASRSYIEDTLESGDGPDFRALKNLRKSEIELERELRLTAIPSHRRRQESSLRYVREEIRELREKLSAEILKRFGHELERLSTVFIETDDIDGRSVFGIDEARMAELQQLVRQIERDLRERFTLDVLKKAALLNDHVVMLLKFVSDERVRQELIRLEKELDQLLQSSVEHHIHMIDSSQFAPFSVEDRHDVRFLLEHGHQASISLWRILLWKFLTRLRRLFRRR